jgi:hypothetical protein
MTHLAPPLAFARPCRSFTRQIAVETLIEASPRHVWSILTDTASVGDWNPFLRQIDGAFRPGARVRVTIQPAGGRAMVFRPRVLVADPGRELRWRGRLVVPGLFDGEHWFRLSARGAATLFEQGETFSGLLVPLVDVGRFRTDFLAMNLALKSRAEAPVHSAPQ